MGSVCSELLQAYIDRSLSAFHHGQLLISVADCNRGYLITVFLFPGGST